VIVIWDGPQARESMERKAMSVYRHLGMHKWSVCKYMLDYFGSPWLARRTTILEFSSHKRFRR